MSASDEIVPMRKAIDAVRTLKSSDFASLVNNRLTDAVRALASAHMNEAITLASDVGVDIGDNTVTSGDSVNEARRFALDELDTCVSQCSDIIDILYDALDQCNAAYRAIGEVETKPPATGIADGSVVKVNAYLNGRLEGHYHSLFTWDAKTNTYVDVRNESSIRRTQFEVGITAVTFFGHEYTITYEPCGKITNISVDVSSLRRANGVKIEDAEWKHENFNSWTAKQQLTMFGRRIV